MLRLFLFFLLPGLLVAQTPVLGYLNPGARGLFQFNFEDRSQAYPQSLLLTEEANGRQHSLVRISDVINERILRSPEYLVPPDVAEGAVTVEIPGKPESRNRTVVTTSPLNFIYAGVDGFAYAQQQRGREAPRLNMFTDAARAGDRITLWATGLREAEVGLVYRGAGDLFSATVTHQSDGLDRIEFVLPESTPADCYLPLAVNGRRLYLATAESDETSCRHPMGLDRRDLLRLDRGLEVPMATVSVSPSITNVQLGNYSKAMFSLMPVSKWIVPDVVGCRLYRPQFFSFATGGFGSPGPPRPIPAELTAPDGTVFSGEGGFWGFGFSPKEEAKAAESPMQQAGLWKFRQLETEFGPASPEKLEFTVPPLSKFTKVPDWDVFSVRNDLVVEWERAAGEPDGFVRFELQFRPRDWLSSGSLVTLECVQPMTAGRLVAPAALMSSVDATQYDFVYPSLTVKWVPRFFRAPDNRYVVVNFGFGSAPMSFPGQ